MVRRAAVLALWRTEVDGTLTAGYARVNVRRVDENLRDGASAADDVEQVRQLKYRYLRTLDTKDWEGFEDCFLPQATADYAGLVFSDRAALVDYMRANLGPEIVTMHHVHHPEITVDGDTATARWYLHDQVISAAYEFRLEGAAFYEDTYRRTSEGWKVAHTGYQRTWEATYPLAGGSGFTLRTRWD